MYGMAFYLKNPRSGPPGGGTEPPGGGREKKEGGEGGGDQGSRALNIPRGDTNGMGEDEVTVTSGLHAEAELR